MIQQQVYTNSDSSANLMSLLLGMVDNAIIMLDAEEQIVVCNTVAQCLYGVTAADVLGRQYSALYTIERYAETREDAHRLAEQLHTTGCWRGVQLHRTRKKQLLSIDVTIQLLPENRYGAQTMLVLRDVTAPPTQLLAPTPPQTELDAPRVLTAPEPAVPTHTDVQLHRSVEQLQLALTALDGFIYDYDIQQDAVQYSAGLIRLLGYQREGISLRASWWISLVLQL